MGRKITHVNVSEDESAAALEKHGIPADYARMLAKLDTYIKEGKEENENDTVFKVTGKQPVRFEEFVKSCIEKKVWEKV